MASQCDRDFRYAVHGAVKDMLNNIWSASQSNEEILQFKATGVVEFQTIAKTFQT